jgi:hypothetical protein
MAAHRGPFRCECGELHDVYDESNDLEPYIHTDGITCLNEAVTGSCQAVFRPLRLRRDEDVALRSTDDDAELVRARRTRERSPGCALARARPSRHALMRCPARTSHRASPPWSS